MSLDVGATVVSLLPFELRESKPGLNPQYFIIPPAKFGDIEVLVIKKATLSHRQPFDMPSIHVPEDLDRVAKSIVEDYVSAKLYTATDFNNPARPGLFWLHGEFSKQEVKEKFADKIEEAEGQQRQWFLNVVKAVDDMWIRTGKQHRVVLPEALVACKQLGIQREWYLTAESAMMPCKNCGTSINKFVATCPVCRVIIDEAKHSKFKFADGPKDPLLKVG